MGLVIFGQKAKYTVKKMAAVGKESPAAVAALQAVAAAAAVRAAPTDIKSVFTSRDKCTRKTQQVVIDGYSCNICEEAGVTSIVSATDKGNTTTRRQHLAFDPPPKAAKTLSAQKRAALADEHHRALAAIDNQEKADAKSGAPPIGIRAFFNAQGRVEGAPDPGDYAGRVQSSKQLR